MWRSPVVSDRRTVSCHETGNRFFQRRCHSVSGSHHGSQVRRPLCAQCQTRWVPHFAVTVSPQPGHCPVRVGSGCRRSPPTSANFTFNPPTFQGGDEYPIWLQGQSFPVRSTYRSLQSRQVVMRCFNFYLSVLRKVIRSLLRCVKVGLRRGACIAHIDAEGLADVEWWQKTLVRLGRDT